MISRLIPLGIALLSSFSSSDLISHLHDDGNFTNDDRQEVLLDDGLDIAAEEGLVGYGHSDCELVKPLWLGKRLMELCLRTRPFQTERTFRHFFSTINVTLHEEGSKHSSVTLDSLNLTYTTGFIKGLKYSASDGFILDGKFYGNVYIENNVYFVDFKENGIPSLTKLQYGKFWSSETITHKLKSQDPQSQKVCDIAVVIDDKFFKDVGQDDVRKTLIQVFWILKEANSVMQSKDFDNDGKPDMISINVAAVTILRSRNALINILDGEYDSPEDFLKQFSRYNFQEFCLGVLFTNRIFEDLVLGLSWRGNPVPGGVGGICQGLARYTIDGKMYSFNSLFVSMKSEQQVRIPLRMAVLNFVHELLHSFGSKHDPLPRDKSGDGDNKDCIPKSKYPSMSKMSSSTMNGGRFLMSRFSNNGQKINHELLSDCTKSAVRKVLKAHHRTKCLRTVSETLCGDGIVQDGEECDCGSVRTCLVGKSKCIPWTGGPDGGDGCTWRGRAQVDVELLVHDSIDPILVPK